MIFTVKDSGKVIGMLELKKLWACEWEISWVEVAPEYRSRGIASGLLKKAIAWADKKRVSLIALVEPQQGGLTKEQERAWLRKNGFYSAWYDFYGHGQYKRVMRRDI